MFFKRKRTYLLATANQSVPSAGVRVTLLLADWLNRHGYKCYSNVLVRDRSLKVPYIPLKFSKKAFDHLVEKEDAISILPEIISENLYKTRTIARYVLGSTGKELQSYKENGNIFVYLDSYKKMLSYDSACRAIELHINPIEMDAGTRVRQRCTVVSKI